MKDGGQTINKVISTERRAGAHIEWEREERVIQGCRTKHAGVEI